MGTHIVTVQLEVSDEFEPTDEFRRPREGEYYYSPSRGAVSLAEFDFQYAPLPIFRRAWKSPSWLPDGCWVYRTSDESGWYCTKNEPIPNTLGGYFCVDECINMRDLSSVFGPWEPPPGMNKIQVKHELPDRSCQ